jgi:hypothetical protein
MLRDRYGFPAGTRPKPSLRQISQEQTRVEKWLLMLGADRSPAQVTSDAKFVSRLRKGVPPALRGRVWVLLVDLRLQTALANTAEALEDASLAEAREAISRDLHRTFPSHVYFSTADGQKVLERVLVRYAAFDRRVGYCQGMSFITAFLLTFACEHVRGAAARTRALRQEQRVGALTRAHQDAFRVLAGVVAQPPWKLGDMLAPDMQGLGLRLFQFNRALASAVPRLAAHLARETIACSAFATQWFLTGFTSSFPFDFVARVWDVFLLEGWPVLIATSVAVMDVHAAQLTKGGLESFFAAMRSIPNAVDTDKVLRRAFGLMRRLVTPALLLRLEALYFDLKKQGFEWHEM